MRHTHHTPHAPHTRHARDTSEAGIATVELALALPILLAVVWALISYGLVFTVDHALSAAASEGARAAVGTATEPDAAVAATAAALDQLDALGSHAANATVAAPSITDCPAPEGTRCLTVQVTYPWATAPIVPQMFSVLMPDQLTATSTIQLSQ